MKMFQPVPVAEPDLSGNEKKYINECIDSGWISSKGDFINQFEEEFARFIGAKYAVTTSNGTTALHLALHALGIGSGDEVIIPDLTFIATANTVLYTGARPILTEVEKDTGNIDADKIEEKITKRTKALLIVHLYGHPSDMQKILTISNRHKLLVIEDAAEAHGAQAYGKRVGGIGDAGCFSFYGNKIITTGEGGMVVSNNKKLTDKMKMLRDHGQDPRRRYYHPVVGFNYRMTNMQAAIGLAQLERIKSFIDKKRMIATSYNSYLSDIKGIQIPVEKSWAKHVYWMYSILVDKPYPKNRDELIEILRTEKIETRPFFYPLHTLPPYLINGNFPNASYLSAHGINLPSSTKLTISDIKRITHCIIRYS